MRPLLVIVTLCSLALTAPVAGEDMLEQLRDQDAPWYDNEEDTWQQPPLKIKKESEDEPEEAKQSSGSSSIGSSSIGMVLISILCVAAAGGIGLLIWQIVSQLQQAKLTSTPDRDEPRVSLREIGFLDDHAELGDDPWKRFLAARQAENWHMAVTWLYAHQLLVLDHAELLVVRRGTTNRRYLAQVAEHPVVHRSLTDTVSVFERSHFGGEAIDGDEIASITAQHDRLMAAVRQEAT